MTIKLKHADTDQVNEFADKAQADNFLANVDSPEDWKVQGAAPAPAVKPAPAAKK